MEASKKIDIYTLSEYIEKVDSLPYTNWRACIISVL